ncbi:hypothetical protein [Terrarubrum flagellatum]|uniref:hypothetical protein n=1 Tax=Terrirubrum flagellatum TaxID=2895980 RepID=UPI0031452BDC
MAAHLLILYPPPADAKAFERAYRDEHLSFAGPRLIGATGVVTKRVVGPAAKPPYHLMSDVTFPALDALMTCAASSGSKEARAHAASISTGGANCSRRIGRRVISVSAKVRPS